MTTRFDPATAGGAAPARAEVRYALTALGEATLREAPPLEPLRASGRRRRARRATLTQNVAS